MFAYLIKTRVRFSERAKPFHMVWKKHDEFLGHGIALFGTLPPLKQGPAASDTFVTVRSVPKPGNSRPFVLAVFEGTKVPNSNASELSAILVRKRMSAMRKPHRSVAPSDERRLWVEWFCSGSWKLREGPPAPLDEADDDNMGRMHS
jgi:hypothetical protein